MRRPAHSVLGLGLATLVLLGLLGSGAVAQAQYYQQAPPPGYGYPPPPPPRYGMYRSGLVFGAALGIGGISAQDCGDTCGAGFAFELHLGGMVTPVFALMGDVWVNTHSIPDSDGTLVHTIYTVAGQYWVTDKLWLKGGIGGGDIQIASKSDNFAYTDENGLAVMAAGGFELLQVDNFALDAQLRLGHGFYSQGGDATNWAIMIGANWY
jgi:hypothetical protein